MHPRKKKTQPTNIVFFRNLTPCHIGLTDNILRLEATPLKEEKNERPSIKSDPRVQINVAASCSTYYFIGINRPFLWSAVSNHALVDKCTLVTFNILCPGRANRTIIGLGCVWRRAPLMTALGQRLLRAARAVVPVCFPRGPNSPAAEAATPSSTQHPNGNNPNGNNPVTPLLPRWCFTKRPRSSPWSRLRHGTALSSLCSHQLPAPSLEGEKSGQLLPAARQPLYCRLDTVNRRSRATKASKWKTKLFWAKREKTVVFFAAAERGVQTVARGDALCGSSEPECLQLRHEAGWASLA